MGLTDLKKDVPVSYADDRRARRSIAGLVIVQIGDRSAYTACVVEEEGKQILIGQIVLEEMDLYVRNERSWKQP